MNGQDSYLHHIVVPNRSSHDDNTRIWYMVASSDCLGSSELVTTEEFRIPND